MSRRRAWTSEEHELITQLADKGYSQSSTVLLLRTRSLGALAAYASRNDIEFHGKQPPWTSQRRARHRAAMREFWLRYRQGSRHAAN